MNKEYRPAEIESGTTPLGTSGFFAPSGRGAPYCIVIPPPNVTGTLHMGHALQDTIMDALIRYHRMRGDDTLWLPGTDHAGIATQMVVERMLERRRQDAPRLGRESLSSAFGSGRSESGGTITQQMRRLGASVDWSPRTVHDGSGPLARRASRSSCACTTTG